MEHVHSGDRPPAPRSWWMSRSFIVALCAVAILGFLVYTGHSAHLLGALPFLFLLACPLMHVFMHGNHGGHGNHQGHHHNTDGGRDDSQQ